MPKRIHLDPKQVVAVLERSHGDRTAAAAVLGVSVATLRRRINDYRLADELYYRSHPGLREADEVEMAFFNGPPRRVHKPNINPLPGYYDFARFEVMTPEEIAKFIKRRPKSIKVFVEPPRRPR